MMKTLRAFTMFGLGILIGGFFFLAGQTYEVKSHASLYVIAEESAKLPHGTIFNVIAEEEGPYYLTPPIKIPSSAPAGIPARDPLIQRIIEPDPGLTEPNTNPVALNSEGKATIFYKPGSYRVSLYAPGVGNICNGRSVGEKIWEAVIDVFDRNGRKYSGGIGQYFNQEGAPAKNGLICIQKTGTTIPETTYKRPTW